MTAGLGCEYDSCFYSSGSEVQYTSLNNMKHVNSNNALIYTNSVVTIYHGDCKILPYTSIVQMYKWPSIDYLICSKLTGGFVVL